MIKVVSKEWDAFDFEYILTLEDGNKVIIPEEKWDLIQIHTSVNGKKLEAIVDEHEDEFEESIQYLGFKLMYK